MSDEELRGHRLESVAGEIVLQKGIKSLATDGLLDQTQEVKAFVIGNRRDAIVGIAAG